MPLKPRTSKISRDFFFSIWLLSSFCKCSCLLWRHPGFHTRWCALQTDGQPPTHTNRKCGLGDGDRSDLEWLEAETPRQVNIWTAASAGWAQTNTDCCCTYHQTGDLHQEKEEVPSLVSQGGRQGDIPGILGTVLGLPAQKSIPVWKVVNVEAKFRRESDIVLSSHQLRRSSLLICKGRSELCGVMQEGEIILTPVAHSILPLTPGNLLCP